MEEPEKIVVTIKVDDEKWTGEKCAEASLKGNESENDSVYNHFDNGSENAFLNISHKIESGEDDEISDGDTITIWAGYRTNESGNETWYLGKTTYTYEKPNTPPVAVAGLSLTGDGEPQDHLEAKLGRDGDVTVYFNSTGCYDGDGDDIVRYMWDLSGEGTFRENESLYCDGEGCEDCGDCPEIYSGIFSLEYDEPGEHIYHFRCCDGEDWSGILEITLNVTAPEPGPDLTIVDMTVKNDNGNPYYEQGDTVVAELMIKNDGNEDLNEDYAINFKSKFRLTQDDGWPDDWEFLDSILIQHDGEDPLECAATEPWSFEWFTGDSGEGEADPGFYKFLIVLDPDDRISEYLEDEDDDLPNMMESVEIELEEQSGGEPDLYLLNFTAPSTAEVEELITITLTVVNDGDGDGFLRIELFVDGTNEARTGRFTMAAGTEELATIEWRAPQSAGEYILQAKLDYKGCYVDTSEEISINIHGCEPPCSNDDGLPDWWEEKYFTSHAQYSHEDDPDGDGYDNMAEYLANTDPTDKKDHPGPGSNEERAGGGSWSYEILGYEVNLASIGAGIIGVISFVMCLFAGHIKIAWGKNVKGPNPVKGLCTKRNRRKGSGKEGKVRVKREKGRTKKESILPLGIEPFESDTPIDYSGMDLGVEANIPDFGKSAGIAEYKDGPVEKVGPEKNGEK